MGKGRFCGRLCRRDNGEAVFADSRLARMYKYCLEGIDADGATVRWRRDFNTVD